MSKKLLIIFGLLGTLAFLVAQWVTLSNRSFMTLNILGITCGTIMFGLIYTQTGLYKRMERTV